MNKNTDRRIASLRAAMISAGTNAVIIPCSDPHGSEFLPAHYTACNWFSGFTGDSCTLVVTENESALWCDGRYFVQADEELAGTEVRVMKMKEPGVPTVEEYLTDALSDGQVLCFDARCLSHALAQRLEKAVAKSGAAVKDMDIISPVWGSERPALPATEAWLLDDTDAGKSIADKLSAARELLAKESADALVEGRLDCLAWLLNLRAMDIECTPYALAFCILGKNICRLFIDTSRLPDAVSEALTAAGVTLCPYEDIYTACAALTVGKVLYDPAAANHALCTALADNKNIQAVAQNNPLLLAKALRNDGELVATRRAHLQDAAAMVRFQMELECRLASGEILDELDIDPILHKYRASSSDFVVESFPTIAAWGPNAASMHYHAEHGHHSIIGGHGFLLVDSGATYRSGTTDITRTYPVGPLTEDEVNYYTWTLQSHIEMARAVWLDYCTGGELDTLAREPLWQHLINYRCGTGHGVAHVGMVHEGPQSLRPHNSIIFQKGMIITDEPGVYETGLVGIRIENELEVVEKAENQYGKWLAFEPLTWVPIDTTALDASQLSADQKAWLNWYHAETARRLAPLLNEAENAWLKEKTKAI